MDLCKKDFIRALLAELLELAPDAVYWGYQSNPKQRGAYAVLNLFARRQEAPPEWRPVGPGKVQVWTPMAATLSVTLADTPDPSSDLEHLASRLGSPSVVEKCAAAGVAFYASEMVQDVSVLDTRAHKRAALDFSVRWTHSDIDDVGYIDQVEANGRYPGSADGDNDIHKVVISGRLE